MFTRKMMVIAAVFAFVVINMIALFLSAKHLSPSSGFRQIGIWVVSPFQKILTDSVHSVQSIWTRYFFLVATEKENEILRKKLAESANDDSRCKEAELSNARFRKLLDFKNISSASYLAAEVIGKDPSPWYKTIIIDKGASKGVVKGLSVIVPEGVVGQVIDVSEYFAKVLLIIDSNSAVDAIVQQTRAHGIVKGNSDGKCLLKYVSRKEAVNMGDTVVSSGLDSVFAKGLQIGSVTEIIRDKSGIFQDIVVSPFVDFEKIEEVLLVLSPPSQNINR